MGKGESFIQEYLVLGSVIGLCLALCYKEVPWSMEPNEQDDVESHITICRKLCYNTDTRMYLKPRVFWEPELPGFEGPYSPSYCFLVSHGDRHIVFDRGLRIDWEEAFPPKIVQLVKATTTILSCNRDVVSVLDEDSSGLNIHSSDIEAVIWSHNHFDHTGDPS
ncbi:hypothetical protein PEX1_072660 [Penicillium expansum]|nr:hypothetical protein PEXP_067830 [Penicillium expansum]KGO73027.1 hypothetical protein PEX1_072660 [Penicillium expansum]